MARPALRPLALLAALLAVSAAAGTRDLGGGFRDHGVATPLSQHRGMVAAADGEGRDVMLVWLYDHRGGYALLQVDAATGSAQQHATPYPWKGDGPFASLLSRAGRYYTHFGGHFSEFDPARRAFTFVRAGAPQMAMSLAEGDDGTIWAATYPRAGLVSYQPATGTFRDHGFINVENWPQYPRSLAIDDAGWVYVGIGPAAAQLVVLEPDGSAPRAILTGTARAHGYATARRAENGRVYVQLPGDGAAWQEYHRGSPTGTTLAKAPRWQASVTGTQALFHDRFPSGRRAVECDTINRRLVVATPGQPGTETRAFDYTSEGAHLIAVAAAPDGTLAGGTAFPMRMFTFDPAADQWRNWPAYGQFNTVVRRSDRFLIGGYGGGFLLDWDARAGPETTRKGAAEGNPRFLTDCAPDINRPHDLLALADGRTVVLAGTPGYGHTGGGLLFWDLPTRTRTLVPHADLLPQQSTMSLVELPGGRILGGTTTAAGTGGEAKATLAELYVLDVASRRILWRGAPLPGVQTYTDLAAGPDGLIYGVADRTRFFVLDAGRREIVHVEEVGPRHGGVVTGQGPRAFVQSPSGETWVLFQRGIARLDPRGRRLAWLADAPQPISAGGDFLDGRIYFASGSHLLSYAPAR